MRGAFVYLPEPPPAPAPGTPGSAPTNAAASLAGVQGICCGSACAPAPPVDGAAAAGGAVGGGYAEAKQLQEQGGAAAPAAHHLSGTSFTAAPKLVVDYGRVMATAREVADAMMYLHSQVCCGRGVHGSGGVRALLAQLCAQRRSDACNLPAPSHLPTPLHSSRMYCMET